MVDVKHMKVGGRSIIFATSEAGDRWINECFPNHEARKFSELALSTSEEYANEVLCSMEEDGLTVEEVLGSCVSEFDSMGEARRWAQQEADSTGEPLQIWEARVSALPQWTYLVSRGHGDIQDERVTRAEQLLVKVMPTPAGEGG